MNVPSWGRVGANGLVVVSGNEALLIDTPWNDSLTSMLCRWGDDNLHAYFGGVRNELAKPRALSKFRMGVVAGDGANNGQYHQRYGF